jgi:hypothetical protein
MVRSVAWTTCVAAALLLPASGIAGGGGHHHHDDVFDEKLSSYQEVPAVSSRARGEFRAEIQPGDAAIEFELSYGGLTGDVQQAHIHFGQKSVNGGIAIFLCTNLGNGPAGTPPCPPAPAAISGTLLPEGVVGPAAQGIGPGEWEELLRAIRKGVAYVNVHSTTFPGGEIRAQLDGEKHRRGDRGRKDDRNGRDGDKGGGYEGGEDGGGAT